MTVPRLATRLLLRSQDVPAYRDDFEVIGVFNPGAVRVGAEAVVVLGQLLTLLAALGTIDGLHDLEGVAVERLTRGAREGSLSRDSAVGAVEDSGGVGDAKR
jgi:hypothetical protein